MKQVVILVGKILWFVAAIIAIIAVASLLVPSLVAKGTSDQLIPLAAVFFLGTIASAQIAAFFA